MSNIIYDHHPKHYKLSRRYKKCEKRNNYEYFELIDINKELHILNISDNGMSKFKNENNRNLLFFDYDKYFSSLPTTINAGKRRCDAIIYTIDDNSYFILNELKDRKNENNSQITSIRKSAKDQLKQTLDELYSVPSIKTFIDSFTNKVCISSNAQPKNTNTIINSALSAFNPIPLIAPNGMNLAAPDINALGFTYWDFKGAQIFKIT